MPTTATPPTSTGGSTWADPDDIRTLFSSAMSTMYRKEVPLYGELLDLVKEVNENTLARNPEIRASMEQTNELGRLHLERHGAIRVGKPDELRMLARIFKLIGMYPVAYYDLSTSGLPVHATAFRPISAESLAKNPFRIFTSLLRPELIAEPATRELAVSVLDKRQIFTKECRRLVEKAESQGGRLDESDAKRFVQEAIETFRWHSRAVIGKEEYEKLSRAHKLAADVVGFQSCHINHLTPRTLDIEAVQRGMLRRGIPPKTMIEGPPPMPCPILLRQTSFLALSEPVEFFDAKSGTYVLGHHQARFGEIEQRSLALTTKGRDLYTELLNRANQSAPVEFELGTSPSHSETLSLNEEHEAYLASHFDSFPSTYEEIRQAELGFFRYYVVASSKAEEQQQVELSSSIDESETVSMDELIRAGKVAYEPIVYEDFLPASAAGIFQSNLGTGKSGILGNGPDRAGFEAAVGCEIMDDIALYEQSQQESVAKVATELGLEGRLVL